MNSARAESHLLSLPGPRRGSVLIVALIIAAAIGISLVSYIKVCSNSLKMANRSFFANLASNLAETGLEEAVWSFNDMGAGTAAATVWSTANGWTTNTTKVAAVTVTNGGTGYTSAPTVAFAGGGGSGVAGTATVASGVVTGVTITNMGSGYTSAPTVTFSGGSGSGATATATNTYATRSLSFSLDANSTATVKIFVAGYDGTMLTPTVVAKATLVPGDGGPTIVKIIQVNLKFNGPFVNGVVAKNGISWNGQPTADSWISNPTNSLTGPWTSYTSAGARSNTIVADLTGSVDLGSQGEVHGALMLGAPVSYGNSGTVSGAITRNFDYTFTVPVYPVAASLDHYTNLTTIPTALPGVLDQPNTADGRYYFFVTGLPITTTTIGASKNVTIVGSGNTAVTGTVTIPATGTLKIYTDGSINGTYVNNAWAGALQIYTSTTAGTTISGNDNIKACIFAPNSAITGNGGGASGAFYGSFVGASVTSNGHMDFHYDESLSTITAAKPWALRTWRELQSAAERATYALQLDL